MIRFILKVSLLFILLFTLISLQIAITQIQPQELKSWAMSTNQEVFNSPKVNFEYGKIPLYFIPNKGQVDEKALFYAKASQYTLWMTKEGLVFDSAKKTSKEAHIQRDSLKPIASGFIKQPINKSHVTSDQLQVTDNQSQMIERDVSRLIFLNTNKNVVIVPEDMTPHRVNYFIGNDKSKWRTNIQTSGAVLYKELYESIDLKVFGIERQIEYDWVVKLGGDVEEIRFEYRDMKGTKIDGEGNLVIGMRFGELMHRRPESYQLIEGRKVEVDVEFKRVGENTYGFSVEEYNRGYDLIIDPKVFYYSTYLGGSNGDWVNGIAVDSSGAAYVSGYTWSTDFPIKNAYQGTHAGDVDVFVTKLSADGQSLVYSTYLGGSDSDCGRSFAVDNSGAAYVSGDTESTDFPIKNAYQGTHAGGTRDVFVTKLSADGTSLVYSTYLGSSSYEDGMGIAVDDTGAAYVSGYTRSYNFPTKNAYQGSHAGGLWDAFITKFSADGQSLVYSTYLGGRFIDWLCGIAVDSSGAAYVIGRTSSTDFPIKNAYQGTYIDNFDVFVTKFSADGQSLVYSTYLGGSDYDRGSSIAVDNSGAAYVSGNTYSTDFPTKNAYQGSHAGSSDAFVTKFSADGQSLVYSTYLGGSSYEDGIGIAVDDTGAAYVSGDTKSYDFPIKNAYQGTHAGGTNDAFVTKFSADGQSLVYSTYLGGTDWDWVGGIAVDNSGETYVTGRTKSTDFPTQNAYQRANAGYMDAFVTKLNFSGNLPPEVKYFRINKGDKKTTDRMVKLDNTCTWNPTEYKAAENNKFTKNFKSEKYSSFPGYQLSLGYGKKKVYFKVKNKRGWSNTKKDTITFSKPEKGKPGITYFGINNGAKSTPKRKVALNSKCTGSPTHYRASEAEFVSLVEFKKAVWKPYKKAPTFSLSKGKGMKAVYFQVKNKKGESGIVCDQIYYGKLPTTITSDI